MAKRERDESRKETIGMQSYVGNVEKEEYYDEENFDVGLTAEIGEVMYFLNIIANKQVFEETGKITIDENNSRIFRVKICYIEYKSINNSVIMVGKDAYGRKIKCTQEYFFQTYEDAKNALTELTKLFNEEDKCDDIYEHFEKTIKIKYRYAMHFTVKPFDILLEKENHFTVIGVEVYIYEDNSSKFAIVPAGEHIYIRGKRVIPGLKLIPYKITKY